MKTDIDERIRQSKSQIRRKQKLTSMLRAAESQLISAEGHQERFKETLAKEQADVKALEGLSFTGIFHYLAGNRDQKLAIEQQQFLAAKVLLEESGEEIARLREEIGNLQEQLVQYQQAETQYEALLAEKERMLASSHSRSSANLSEISQRLDSLADDERELEEAITAGRRAQDSLEQVQATLRSAGNWGTFDMFGGGMMASMIKHSKLDEARDRVRYTQQLLHKFERELADANQRLQVSLEIEGFSRFADMFFDGIIADWAVQSKIEQSQEACSQSISIVQSVVRQCQNRLLSVQREADELKKQRVSLIESTELGG